jgi:hypothetical protein
MRDKRSLMRSNKRSRRCKSGRPNWGKRKARWQSLLWVLTVGGLSNSDFGAQVAAAGTDSAKQAAEAKLKDAKFNAYEAKEAYEAS